MSDRAAASPQYLPFRSLSVLSSKTSLKKTLRTTPEGKMVAQARVVFRVEPENPDLQQAMRDISYGTAMQAADVATLTAALHNILDLLISAMKESSSTGSAFLSCFKNKVNWPAMVGKFNSPKRCLNLAICLPADFLAAVIVTRCEAIIRYCLGEGDMQHVQRSLGTLRLFKVSFFLHCR